MNTKEYQSKIFDSLNEIFEEEDVKKEWDSLKYDSHTSNHKQIYGPRLDIAVGGRTAEKVSHSPLRN